jgi:hypothetical protein
VHSYAALTVTNFIFLCRLLGGYKAGRLCRAITIGLSCCDLFIVRRAGSSGSGIILHILFLDDFEVEIYLLSKSQNLITIYNIDLMVRISPLVPLSATKIVFEDKGEGKYYGN